MKGKSILVLFGLVALTSCDDDHTEAASAHMGLTYAWPVDNIATNSLGGEVRPDRFTIRARLYEEGRKQLTFPDSIRVAVNIGTDETPAKYGGRAGEILRVLNEPPGHSQSAGDWYTGYWLESDTLTIRCDDGALRWTVRPGDPVDVIKIHVTRAGMLRRAIPQNGHNGLGPHQRAGANTEFMYWCPGVDDPESLYRELNTGQD